MWWHAEGIEAARWLESNYPGRYDSLNLKRQGISKIDLQIAYLMLSHKTGTGKEGKS